MDFFFWRNSSISVLRSGNIRYLKLSTSCFVFLFSFFFMFSKMDFVLSLIGFLMAVCHVALRVKGEDGEFWLLLDFDARVI